MTDAKTFDLAEVLAGRGYPETVVSVYLDESAGYLIGKMNQRLAQLVGEEYAAAEKELEEAAAELAAQCYKFHLRGISRKVKKDLLQATISRFPVKKDMLGRAEENTEADEFYANLIWAAYVNKIVAPDGSEIIAPSETSLAEFRDLAPKSALDAIESALEDLDSGTKSGFEATARMSDFLSQPSLEG